MHVRLRAVAWVYPLIFLPLVMPQWPRITGLPLLAVLGGFSIGVNALVQLVSKSTVPPLLSYFLTGLAMSAVLAKMSQDITWGIHPVYLELDPALAAIVRTSGLGLILSIAGMEIDVPTIRNHLWPTLRLTVFPGVSEALAITGVAYFWLGLPLPWSASLGFIIGAVSPAVVCGGMFELQRNGYGTEQGIPSLVVAAASLDDVVAVSGFSVAWAFARVYYDNELSPEGDSTGTAMEKEPPGMTELLIAGSKGPATVLFGVTASLFLGRAATSRIFWKTTELYTDPRRNKRDKKALVSEADEEKLERSNSAERWDEAMAWAQADSDEDETSDSSTPAHERAYVIAFLATLAAWAGSDWGIDGGGYLAALGSSLVASHRWRGIDSQKSVAAAAHSVTKVWERLGEPLLFVFVGASVKFSAIQTASLTAGTGVVLVCCFLVRVPMAFFAVSGQDWTFREKLFVSLAWMPKATVQAALGSLPLDYMLKEHGFAEHDGGRTTLGELRGRQILTVSAISILLTAPAGALVVSLLGRRMLRKEHAVLTDFGDEMDSVVGRVLDGGAL